MPRFEGETVATMFDRVKEILRLHRQYGGLELMAMEFIDDYGEWIESQNTDDPDCDGRHVAKQNIGYMAGYESNETKHEIFDLFECEHPLMGKSDPTPEEAFKLGQEWGLAMKEGRPFP